MGLIVVNAKVKLMSEYDLENLSQHENMGTEPKSIRWRWRSIAIHTDDIKRVIEYNPTKTIILGYDGEYTLVDELFAEVYRKWDESKEGSAEFIPDFNIDDEKETQEGKDEDNEE